MSTSFVITAVSLSQLVFRTTFESTMWLDVFIRHFFYDTVSLFPCIKVSFLCLIVFFCAFQTTYQHCPALVPRLRVQRLFRYFCLQCQRWWEMTRERSLTCQFCGNFMIKTSHQSCIVGHFHAHYKMHPWTEESDRDSQT